MARVRQEFSLGFTSGSYEIPNPNTYVEKIRAAEGRDGWPGGKAWSIDARKHGILRKNPKSEANERKPFSLIGSVNSLRHG
jgi:hypothetical protein